MQLDYLKAGRLKVIIKKGPLSSHISESRRNKDTAFKQINITLFFY